MKDASFDIHIEAATTKRTYISETLKYKDLIWLFTKRNIALTYRQTILGPLWILISPLFTTVVFTFVFGQLAQISTDGIPQFLFYMCGNCLWILFAGVVNGTCNTLTANNGMFSKVYFPRLSVPISQALTSLINFFVQILMFVVFYIYFLWKGANIAPTIAIVLVPFILLHVVTLALGCGLVLSAITVKYRDLLIAVGFAMQLWMYMSPVVYPYSLLSGFTQVIVKINPITFPLELFRYAVLGEGTMDIGGYALSMIITIFVFFIGIVLFEKAEKTAVDIA